MKCPYCGNRETEVVETRDNEELESIRRRRSCVSCGKRFTTYERIENVSLFVIKKDGRRELFDRDKLRKGMLIPCQKTIVSLEQVDILTAEIDRELRGRDSVEISSAELGEIVAQKLKKIDKVAYIRFASVFKRFVDAEDFEREVKKLIQ